MSDATDPEVVTRYEQETWGRCADRYLDTFAGITSETVPRLQELAGVGAGKRVLEIGSGPGHVAGMLAEAGAAVTGVDFSPQMVAVAQARYPALTFQEANAEDLPFADACFDAVVSNFAVHHLARPDAVFREAARVLKPGGRFAFAVWGEPEQQTSIGAFFAAFSAHMDLDELPHGPLFGVTDRAVFEPMLSGAGLGGCALETRDVSWRCEGLEPVLRGFWDWGNLDALPQELQDKIEASTRENAAPFAKDGGYEFPHTILFGSATRE